MRYYRWVTGLSSIVFLFILLISQALAGQVITEDVRSWAKKVLQEEKSLQVAVSGNTLAVLYFQNKTGNPEIDPVQKGMALMLITDLSTIEGLQVVERVRLQALAEEIGLGTSGLVASDTAPRVGKLLGARWLVGGDILGQPAQLKVQSNLLDVPENKIFGQPVTEGQLAELFRIEKDLLFEVIRTLKIEITPERESALKKPCSTKTKALMELFNGIDESDKGEYKKAGASYKNALKEDPNVCIAGDALNELQGLGLLTTQKKGNDILQSLKDQTSLTDQLAPKDATRRELTPKDLKNTIDIDVHFP